MVSARHAAAITAITTLVMGAAPGLSPQSLPRTGPPLAAPRPVADEYYGRTVIDPYRYLENFDNREVQSWVKAQTDYTRAVLDSIPGRDKLLARMRDLDRSASVQVESVSRVRGQYFYRKLRDDEDVWKLYVGGAAGETERLLVDPERIAIAAENRPKGKNALVYFAPSHDARYVAVGIAPGGSEADTEIHVIETGSGRRLDDRILRAVGPRVHWLPDNESFLYGRRHRAVRAYGTYLHRLRTDGEQDQHVFASRISPPGPAGLQAFSEIMTQPGSPYAVGIAGAGAAPNSAFYVVSVEDIGRADAGWRRVADLPDQVSAVTWRGHDLYALTFRNAPRHKVVHVDLRNPDLASARTIVPESNAVITRLGAARDGLYVQLREKGASRMLRVPFGSDSPPEPLPLPFAGAIAEWSLDPGQPGIVFAMTSWTRTRRTFAYDAVTKRVDEIGPRAPESPADRGNLEAVALEVRSDDGTLVPLSIVRAVPAHAASDRDAAPAILTVYGAYGYAHEPVFVPPLLSWYEQGGIWAICHARGGGEYGHEWHAAGSGPLKSRTWRDFIACAEHLAGRGYTVRARLAAEGASAGGIPVGRAMTERPDLFGAALINVGLSDMLRNETTPSGMLNIPEFGTVKTSAGFEALYAMSAYAHVQDGVAYPAVLLTTGVNDPRVAPWHAAKMTARLQRASTSGRPVLLRVDYAGGHLADAREQLRQHLADQFSFVLWHAGVPDFQPRLLHGAIGPSRDNRPLAGCIADERIHQIFVRHCPTVRFSS